MQIRSPRSGDKLGDLFSRPSLWFYTRRASAKSDPDQMVSTPTRNSIMRQDGLALVDPSFFLFVNACIYHGTKSKCVYSNIVLDY
jgi:hypothetical protein